MVAAAEAPTFRTGGAVMLYATFALLLSYPFLALRLQSSGGSFPKPLSAQEERECLERCAAGDMEARSVLIERNLRLVAHIIKKYYTQAGDQDDLISIGTIGLIKGISTYKQDKGVRLATYASRCIENEVLMYFRRQRKSAGDLSLSDAIDTDKEGGELSLMDVVCVEDDVLEDLSSEETYAKLREYVGALLEGREREIVTLRYGLGGAAPMTQREIADSLGISRSYVSRIEKKALEKLKKRLTEDGI